MSKNNIEAIYPLSPLQQGLLFHALYDPESEDYFEQLSCTIQGPLDVTAFVRSWQQVIDRHPILRTAFLGERRDKPLQVVRQSVVVPFEQQDWRARSAAEQQQQLTAWLTTDRRRGFQLSVAPLMRLLLIELSERRYQFVWSSHHLLLDGWSLSLILKEVFAYYGAYSQGRELALAQSRPYRDYIAWLQQQDLSQAEAHWRQTLKGFSTPTRLEVGTAFTDSSGPLEERTEYHVWLSAEVTAELQGLARRQQLTLNTLVQGAWAVLLSRYSGQADVLFGTVVSGRPASLPGVEQMVGLFINTLPLRVQVAPEQQVIDWLQQLQVQQVEMRQYEHSPLVDVQGWSDMPRGVQMFDTLLVFENYPVQKALQTEEEELKISNFRFVEQTNYPITVAVAPGRELSLRIAYDDQRHEGETIKRMLGHFQTLLGGIASNPEQRVSELPLLTPAEQEQLRRWTDNATEYPRQGCVHQLIEAQAERTPDARAVSCGNRHLSYRELNSRANQLAHHLRRLGVGPEVKVGLLIERSVEMVVSLLAIFKAGGAYVPLDPAYPSERLSFMLADAGLLILVTQSDLREKLQPGSARVVCLDEQWDEIAQASTKNPTGEIRPEQLAYVIYTSGSTGQPKGVLVEHRELANTILASQAAFRFTAQDTMACLASFAFDIFLFEALNPLLAGGCCLLLAQDEVLAASSLLKMLDEVTCVHAVPSLMRHLVDQAKEHRPGSGYQHIRRVFVGGEAVSAELLGRIQEVFDQAELYVLYGPTEATIICGSYRVEDAAQVRGQMIGRALSNTVLQLRDQNQQLVPVGLTGEIYIGGSGVTRGYLNREELTEEKYVSIDGVRYYRSGDVGRYLADGNIEFLGRTDEQVKVRGFRIEVGEVEAALKADHSVREAVVIAREDLPGDKRLVAYVVADQQTPAGTQLTEDTDGLQLWPSIGEYFVYDELIYHGLSNDQRRNDCYLRVLQQTVKDKVVVDVGTGQDAILARLCVEAGARHVYAIEIVEETYRLAQQRIVTLGLEDRITVIHSDATKVQLPELVDVCVAEIVEAIGGAEGAATIMNSARHLLKPAGIMIPQRSVTKIAAVTLPDELRQQPHFTPVSAHYVERIFAQVGHRFDVRLCIKNFPAENLISSEDIFEDLDFEGGAEVEYEREVRLQIKRAGRVDGFLVWLRLQMGGGEVIDIMEERYSWFPVYFPVFDDGPVQVGEGDIIEASCSAKLSDNGLNPDYSIRGRVVRGEGEDVEFAYDSVHHTQRYKANSFYARLFADAEIRVGASRLKQPSESSLEQSLREHLKSTLPEHMMPSSFVWLESLPLTPTGKIDRSALPAPGPKRADELAYIAPRTAVEDVLCSIWADLLGIEQVGIHDNFFALGGHSLLATRLMSRVRETFHVELALRELFERATVVALAERVETAVRGAQGVEVRQLSAVERGGELPLSFAQQRLWFLDQLEAGSAFYSIPLGVRLSGKLNQPALEQSLTEIVRRHEVMRSRFTTVAGRPTLVIDLPAAIAVPVLDFGDLAQEECQAEVERLAAAEARRPFDLAGGPLWRVQLLRLSADEHVLLFSIHHIITDGWSMGILVREVSVLYEAFSRGESSPLAELAIQYADYAVWQQQWLTGDVLEQQLGYWREQLRDAPAVLELPTDRVRPAVQSFRGANVEVEISREVSAGLAELSRREGVTLYMTLLAAFKVLLMRYSGQEDICVGSPSAGRAQMVLEGLIGFFVNTQVMRTDLSGNPGFRELLKRVREVTLGAYAHQDAPFEKLVEVLQPERNLSHTPLFQVWFVLQNAPVGELRLSNLTLSQIEIASGTAKFDLSLSLTEGPDGLKGIMEYDRDLFDAHTIAGLVGHLEVVLREVVKNPDSKLLEIPLLGEGARMPAGSLTKTATGPDVISDWEPQFTF